MYAMETAARRSPTPLIGFAGGLGAVAQLMRRAAQTDATVLIQGETGTGKELVARALHEQSRRAGGPFVALNCAALPEGLVESELFGHEQGAFTGAARTRKGRFELARGGSLFLDEIGDVPSRVQVSLLRALQERRIERVGGEGPIGVDVRIIAATHRDLGQRVAAGIFREDLYYRLNVIVLVVPPLRQRPQDIPELVAHFVRKWQPTGAPAAGSPPLAPDVLPALARYPWPGNVRELENAIQRAVTLCDGAEITLADFALGERVPEPSVRLETQARHSLQLREILLAHGGNVSRAARAIGVPRTTLVSRAKRLGVL